MPQHFGRGKRGFTLIELAIVLTIAGLLFVGLWRLLSGGNQQVRDQGAGSEQQQLISGVKGYLASAQGTTFLNTLPAAGTASVLSLPTTNSPVSCLPVAVSQFCNYLPSGFVAGTTNSYGQTYSIMVERNDISVSPNTPSSYSFMIVTLGGDTIPDTSGGRISAAIGGDGGFIYTSATVCANTLAVAANLAACGAYGTWQTSVTAYGFAGTASGHIASRTFVSPTADSQFPWLARPVMPNDPTFIWNTMKTDLYMGGTSAQTPPGYSNIYLTPFNPVTNTPFTAGGSTIFMEGGQIDSSNGNTGATIQNAYIQNTGDTFIVTPPDFTVDPNNPGLQVNAVPNGAGTCQYTTIAGTSNFDPASCKFALKVITDAYFGNFVYAGSFFSPNLVYQQSDIRFKTNIKTLTNALDDVMKLNPVSFTFKSSGQPSLGVIAQDVEKIYPQLVGRSPMDGTKTVYYNGFIAPLIGAVQELKNENDSLREQMKRQEIEIKALEEKLNKRTGAP